VAESARELAKQMGFELKTEIQNPMPKVWMDGEAVSRALFNLLDNAFKYSETSKNIFLRASSKNQEISWEIQDHGIGIPEEEKMHIFEKFYRYPHQQENDVKGSGIGLTIVKHIVEAHLGQINVDSKPGKGTTFTLSIPSGTNTDK
jgi:signal transduction histidine kinase